MVKDAGIVFRMDVGCGKDGFWSETMVFCEGWWLQRMGEVF